MRLRQVLREVPLLGLAVLLTCTSSCVHNTTRTLSPSYSEGSVRKLRSFHVRRHDEDDHGLSRTIAGELQKMGYKATEGPPDSKAASADALVTYIDRWYWDITPYMLSLSIQLREPGSESVIATAQTTRSSLARKSPENMANETLSKALGKSE